MTFRELFHSRLFRRTFIERAVTTVMIFVAAYAFTVPYTLDAIETSEERSAHAVLDNVYGTIEQIHRGLENGRQNLREARKQTLRDIVSIVESRARWLDGEVAAGRMDRAHARQTLFTDIRQMRYGNNDYVFGLDYRSVTIAHPDPRLNGKDMSSVRDVHGNLIVPPMVEGARKSGEGFHSYWWRRLGEDVPVEKLSYYKHLPNFELVIGTGQYMDDIEKAIEIQRGAAIEKLRQTLRSTHIAKTGYVYIFDSQMYMHIHPNANIEHNSSLASQRPPGYNQAIGPLLVAVADKAEGLRYLWDRPDDPGRYIHPKISWVRHFKPFDWYVGSSVYVDELHENARSLTNRLLIVFAAGLLLSLIVSFLVAKKMVEPLRKIADTANALGRGERDARCAMQRIDEIGVVASAFDAMADRLNDTIATLDDRVRDRTAELERANEELRQMDSMKSDFLSSVSHELRTPLTSIRGFVSLVERDFTRTFAPLAGEDSKLRKKSERIQENLGIVQKESERLTRLINDVLDLAKIESGKIEWREEPIEIASLVQDAVNATKGMFAPKPDVALTLDVAENLPAIVGDADRLQQVLVNLINNAVKFTERGAVTVAACLDDVGTIRIEVRDTGTGFPPEEAESIFDKFQQSQNSDVLTNKPQGTGLGLAICKEIVEHHGGRIWASSVPGSGSIFAFTLPHGIGEM